MDKLLETSKALQVGERERGRTEPRVEGFVLASIAENQAMETPRRPA